MSASEYISGARGNVVCHGTSGCQKASCISNIRTGVIGTIAEHPIHKCFLAGLQVTVNTDDPKMFDTCWADFATVPPVLREEPSLCH